MLSRISHCSRVINLTVKRLQPSPGCLPMLFAARHFSESSKPTRSQPIAWHAPGTPRSPLIIKQATLPASTPKEEIQRVQDNARRALSESNLSRMKFLIGLLPRGEEKDRFIQEIFEPAFEECKRQYDEDLQNSHAVEFDWWMSDLIQSIDNDTLRTSMITSYTERLRTLSKKENDIGFEKVAKNLEFFRTPRSHWEIDRIGTTCLDMGEYPEYLKALQQESCLSEKEKIAKAESFLLEMAKTANLKWTPLTDEQLRKCIVGPFRQIQPTGAVPTFFAMYALLKDPNMPGSDSDKKAAAEKILKTLRERKIPEEDTQIFQDYLNSKSSPETSAPQTETMKPVSSFISSFFSRKK